MEDRFGIPKQTFKSSLLYEKSKGYWIMNDTPEYRKMSHLKPVRFGVKGFQKIGAFIKPCTRLIQHYGHLATKAVQEISRKELEQLLNKEIIPNRQDLDSGYIILKHRDMVMGLGLVGKDGIISQLPSKELRI